MWRWAVALFLSCLITAKGWADEDILPVVESEHALFAASHYLQSLGEAPGNVTVLTREDIRRYGYRSLFEAISTFQGVYDARAVYPQFGMRGLALPLDYGGLRVQYLINGSPVYDSMLGVFFFDLLDIDSVERIEYIRGGGSPLYGTGAIFGIINFVTVNPRTDSARQVVARVGSHGYGQGVGNWGWTEGDSSLFLSLGYTGYNGRDLYLPEWDSPKTNHGWSVGNEGSETARLFLRAVSGQSWFQLTAGRERNAEPYGSFATLFNSHKLKLIPYVYALDTGTSWDVGQDSLATLRGYWTQSGMDGYYPYGSGQTPLGETDSLQNIYFSSRNWGLEGRLETFPLDGHHLFLGGEIRDIQSGWDVGYAQGFFPPFQSWSSDSASYRMYSLYVHDEISLRAEDKIFAGIRTDHFTHTGKTYFSPKLAWVHTFGDGSQSKLVASRAYRAPTTYESLYQDNTPQGINNWANPNLLAETNDSLEAVWEKRASRWDWNLSLFYNRLADVPIPVETPIVDGIPCLLYCVQYQNASNAFAAFGFEAGMHYRWLSGAGAYANLSLQRARALGMNSDLPNSPHFVLKGGYNTPLPWMGWDGAVEVAWVDGMKNYAPDRADVPAYFVANGTLSRKWASGWRTALRIDNLFDRDIYTVAAPELVVVQRVPREGRIVTLTIGKDF